MKRILILGGTGDAAALAKRLVILPNLEVITSLAGRTEQPLPLDGGLRVGGFGGVTGLVDFLQKECIDWLVDATHPFAAQISHHAAEAARLCGVGHLMLVRPAWERLAGDYWVEVASHGEAVQVLPGLGRRVFLTIGRQEVASFAGLQGLWFLMRMIDPPAPNVRLPLGELLLARGPFLWEEERDLLVKYGIDVVVSKNSGGAATYGKIRAARELGLPVVMVARPPMPVGEQVRDVESALSWLMERL